MPRVPRYDAPKVQEASTPNVRFNTNVSQDTFGGGQSAANLNRSVGGVLNKFNKIQLEEKRKADNLASLEADQKLSSIETRLVYDPEVGAVNKKGKDAFGVSGTTLKSFDSEADAIEKSLSNEDQKMAFRKMRISRRAAIEKQLTRHMSREINQHDKQVTESYLLNEQDAATKNFHDEGRVQISIQRQQAAIYQHAERNGMPEEWIKNRLKGETSKTHSSVINQLVNLNQDERAKEYFKKYKDQLTGKDSASLSKVLKEGSLRGGSQRKADKILDKAGDRKEALGLARKIKDPELRDLVEKRVNSHFSIMKQAEREEQDSIYQNAINTMEKNLGQEPRELIPVQEWEKLSLAQRKSLESRGDNPDNNDKIWLDFLEKSPKDIASLTRAEFESEYWVNFDASHRSRAEKMWKESQDPKAQAKLTNTLSFKDRVDNTLRGSGVIDPNKSKGKFSEKEVTLYSRFEDSASKAVEEYELNELAGKRKATGQEVQKILDKIILQKVFVDKNWIRRDPEVPISLISDDDKKKAYVPFEDITKEHRESISNLIKSKGKKFTKDKLERAYGAYILKDKTLFNSIIGE